jgi:hypothetical protein
MLVIALFGLIASSFAQADDVDDLQLASDKQAPSETEGSLKKLFEAQLLNEGSVTARTDQTEIPSIPYMPAIAKQLKVEVAIH